MVEDTVCTIGVYGGRQPSILVNNHLVYGRMPDSETQPDIIADVPKNRLVANLNPASDGMTDSPRLPLELFAAWLANGLFGAGFYIASFGSAFVASIVISLVSALVNGLIGNDA